ncbi:MAG: tRNA lysidine(34) synthetase TilS, partial [Balneolaceae bacterium]
KFLNLPTRLYPIIFHRFIQNINPDIHLTAGMLSEVSKLVELQTGGSMKFTDGCTIVRNRDVFEWVDPEMNEKGEVLQFTMIELQQGVKVEEFFIEIEKFEDNFKKGHLYLDVDPLRFPIYLRPWKEGDMFQPLGMNGSQLVSDHLTNRKIKASEKSLSKVVESFDGTICAVIFPHSLSDGQIGTISELVKCTPGTKKTMSIRKTD